jgi:thioredoxin-dependent peroxiredoxin
MTEIHLNQPVPDFTINGTSGQTVRLSDLRGKRVLLYFYPKDNTPGCTQQGIAFRDHYAEFEQLNTQIFGISRDSLKSHEGFKAKQAFPFELLSDADEALCRLFDVIKMKNMYGKQVQGIERSTFLLDENGNLIKEWRKVQVKNHIPEVLAALKAL